MTAIKRALISVYDKTHIVEFAQFLCAQNIEIIATGGSYACLTKAGFPVIEISTITNFPELLDGRVKTLHPHIHAGILAKRDNALHIQQLEQFGIATIDMMIVNLYPFFTAATVGADLATAIELIDIGGVALLRAGAKAFTDVVVLSDYTDYEAIQKQIAQHGTVCSKKRQLLAAKAFNLTAGYDAAISEFLLKQHIDTHTETDQIATEALLLPFFNCSYTKVTNLSYGENPHQQAAYYRNSTHAPIMRQLHGKALSFNNIADIDIALNILAEFPVNHHTADDQKHNSTAVAIKHNTPCAVAVANSTLEAYLKLYQADAVSIFGGVIAINSIVDKETAEALIETFLEIIIAPAFAVEALKILSIKKNLRLISYMPQPITCWKFISTTGGMLVQQADTALTKTLQVVSLVQPTENQLRDLMLAFKVVKHVKSNAIVVAANNSTLGIGMGQTNRLWATQHALAAAANNIAKQDNSAMNPTNIANMVLASDGFFPFRDCVDMAIAAGIVAIIQPGGSLRDAESIAACNEANIAMVTTGMRHFRH